MDGISVHIHTYKPFENPLNRPHTHAAVYSTPTDLPVAFGGLFCSFCNTFRFHASHYHSLDAFKITSFSISFHELY